MKISALNDAVTRINKGDNAEDVLNDLHVSTKLTLERIVKQLNNAAKSRSNWRDAASKVQAAYVLKNPLAPLAAQALKVRKKGIRPEKKPYVLTPQATMRRRRILLLLSKHAAGLTTRALMEDNKCDRYTLHTDMAPLLDEGKVVHSVVMSGKPTIWRLAK
jgi:hypothetical protein